MEQVNTLGVPTYQLAEESVIGALLIDRDGIIKIAHRLKPSDFHQERLGILYQAILNLYTRQAPADVVLLYAELERMESLDKVGWDFCPELVLKTPTAAHLEYYAELVVEYALRRAMIQAGGNIAALGYDRQAEIEDLVARAQGALTSVAERAGADAFITAADMADAFCDRQDAVARNSSALVGIPTGFTRWDTLTGGLRDGSLVIVAARPGMGKTTWACNVIHHAARKGHKVGVFSLEMGREEIFNKLIGIETGIDTKCLETPYLSTDERSQIQAAAGALGDLPWTVEDKSPLLITELSARATRMKNERGLDLLIVDYLQLVHGTPRKNGIREQEVSEVARGLKEIARSLHIPVIACCQLNRAVEGRADKVPQLSDLRESGEIEQAADIVVFIHRDEEYNKASQRNGIADLYIKKHRNGPTGTIPLYCDLKSGRFGDLALNG